MRWIRLDLSWSHSEWLSVLSAESRLSWIELLCYIKGFGTAGRARAMTPDRFARMIYVGEESVRQMLKAAESHGALRIVDSDWLITKWMQYQGDETNAERQRRFRANKNPGVERITVPSDAEVFSRDGYVCVTCGATDDLQVDHIIPSSLGGGDSLDNLQTLCGKCNRMKGNRLQFTLRNALCNDVTTTETVTETETVTGKKKEPSVPKKNPFSEEEAIAYGKEIGLSPAECSAFYDHHLARGFCFSTGKPIRDWKACCRTWKRNAEKFGKASRAETLLDRRNRLLKEVGA